MEELAKDIAVLIEYTLKRRETSPHGSTVWVFESGYLAACKDILEDLQTIQEEAE